MRSSKKKVKKRSTIGAKAIWQCPQGCKLGRSACAHLEALIAPRGKEPKFESTHRYVGQNVDKAYLEFDSDQLLSDGVKNKSYEIKFRIKLEKAGLEPVKVDILILRYMYDMNFKDIAEEVGIKSIGTIYDLYGKALKTLKKRGFK